MRRRRSGGQTVAGTVRRLPVVGVMGSGTQAHVDKAEPLGRWLAGLGVHLLTGGGPGVMAAASRAFAETPGRAGWVIGIVPGEVTPQGYRPRAGYPNPWVEIPILTHLPLSGAQGMDPRSRNHINVLSATVVVALPGGSGTASEVGLALRYGRPVVAWLDRPEQIPDLPGDVPVVGSLEDVQRFVQEHLP